MARHFNHLPPGDCPSIEFPRTRTRPKALSEEELDAILLVAGGGGVQTFAIDAETREVLRIRIRPQLGVVVDFVPAETE